MAISLLGIAGVAQHQRSRYEVSNEISNGQNLFKHHDPETTHVLNVISGKESWTDSDKKEYFIQYLNQFENASDFEGGYSLENLNTKTMDELRAMFDFLKKKNILLSRRGLDDVFRYDENIYSEELYNAIWKMEMEAGNPKVRLDKPLSRPIMQFKYTCYDPVSNTLYIGIGDGENLLSQYLSELSHAHQFNRRPARTLGKFVKDISIVLGEALTSTRNVADHYGDLYSTPGTVEHEAHSVIEPDLVRRFTTMIPTTLKDRDRKRVEYEREISDLDSHFSDRLVKLDHDFFKKWGFCKDESEKNVVLSNYHRDKDLLMSEWENAKNDVMIRHGK